ncbi:MarR family winged helix-turn-helix transcriptional regulator [Pontimicrobium sp. MEBiC01747]
MRAIPSKTLFYSIEKAIKSYRKLAQEKLSEVIDEITIDQVNILAFIEENPTLPLKDIAALTFTDDNEVSLLQSINVMVEKGYLKQHTDADSTKTTIIVTDNGKSVLESLSPIIIKNRRKALDGITLEELIQVETILKKIATNCN